MQRNGLSGQSLCTIGDDSRFLVDDHLGVHIVRAVSFRCFLDLPSIAVIVIIDQFLTFLDGTFRIECAEVRCSRSMSAALERNYGRSVRRHRVL